MEEASGHLSTVQEYRRELENLKSNPMIEIFNHTNQ